VLESEGLRQSKINVAEADKQQVRGVSSYLGASQDLACATLFLASLFHLLQNLA
jgi:hypothetical protein